MFSAQHLVALLIQYRYLILLPIAIVEGPIVTIIAGFLCFQGHLSILPVYGIVILGDLIGDVLWYYVGYWYGYRFVKKYGKRFGLQEEKIHILEEKFHKYKHPILFFSKITNGLGFALAVLFTAGLVKIPFWRFMTINFFGQFIWSGALLAIGYFFGNVYSTVSSIQEKIGISVIVVILLIIGVKYIRQISTSVV